MLHKTLKPILNLTFRSVYRSIDIIQRERIPEKGPVIFVANHPTAFMDPVLLAVFQKRTLHFLTRGDFFNKPAYGRLLSSLHVMPLYRMNESGFAKVKSNLSTFDHLFEAFRKNKTILVSVEGNTTHEKRLRPIKRGAANMALGALESGGIEEIYLVPVGFSFTYAERFRSDLMIIFDEPIKASDFLSGYLENKGKGVRSLTEEIKKRLEANVVLIDKEKEDVAEAFFTLYRSDYPRPFWPVITDKKEQLFSEKAIADEVNAMNTSEYEEWDIEQKKYFSTLENKKLEDASVVQKNAYNFLNSLLLFFGFLPALLGYIWSWLPMFPGKYLAANKVRRLEFKASVRMGVSMGAVLIYSLLWLIISWICSSIWLAVSVPVMLGAAYFCIWYLEIFHKWKQGRLLKKIPASEFENIKRMRLPLKMKIEGILHD